MPKQSAVDFAQLIPELPDWNNGAGIDISGWLSCSGNFQLAIAFTTLFWPRFVEFDNCVLFEGFSDASYRGFMQQTKQDRGEVEAVMNHRHILDIFPAAYETATEAQIRYLGRMLKKMWECKLVNDFPNRTFEVHFNDDTYSDLLDYQITFWQLANRAGV